ncbi:MAG: hypothetical protein ACYDBB_22420 [Armatimonadota bacterium]
MPDLLDAEQPYRTLASRLGLVFGGELIWCLIPVVGNIDHLTSITTTVIGMLAAFLLPVLLCLGTALWLWRVGCKALVWVRMSIQVCYLPRIAFLVGFAIVEVIVRDISLPFFGSLLALGYTLGCYVMFWKLWDRAKKVQPVVAERNLSPVVRDL